MIYLPISECKIGDIIAKPITNSSGLILVAENTTLNRFIKDKLLQTGDPKVWIYKVTNKNNFSIQGISYEIFKYNYANGILMVKELLNCLASQEKVNCKDILKITDLIYDVLGKSNSIVRYLQKIHSVDQYTYTHSINVSLYAMLIARWLNLSEKEIKKVIQAGLLHDIGKIRIDNKILNKKGKLTDEEFEEIKKHTILGYDLVKEIDCLDSDIKDAILMHHERVDRSGYPLKTSGENINLCAKIIAIADVYDAMTSDRVYKKKATPFKAFEMFITVGWGIFDTTALMTFINKLAPYYIGCKVVLDNGEIGEIAYIPPQNVTSPIVISGDRIIDFSKPNKTEIVSFCSAELFVG